jgi:large subunit ribosomal protein L25
MSTDTTLKAELREGTGKGVARKLRSAGRLPAVVYGGKGEPQHLSLDAHDAEYMFRNISVDNTIVDLDIEGEQQPVQTLVREIQMHPWKASLVHVDFLRIQAGVAVEMVVPLHLIGDPVGVTIGGGTVEQIIHDLPIRCIPSKIPEVLEVDISGLDLNDALHVSDITLGEGVEVTIPLDRTICSVAVPRAEMEPGVEDEEAAVGEEAAEGAAPEGAETEDAGGDEG